MPNESSGKDLKIIVSHFYVRLLRHGVICITKNQDESNCFRHILPFPGHLSIKNCFTITEKLALRFP